MFECQVKIYNQDKKVHEWVPGLWKHGDIIEQKSTYGQALNLLTMNYPECILGQDVRIQFIYQSPGGESE